MKKPIPWKKPGRRGRPAGKIRAALIVLPGLAVVVAMIFNSLQVGDHSASARSVNSGRPVPLSFYLRSGQWLADVRTFAAACHYILEPDVAQIPGRSPLFRTLTTTNVAAGEFKARPIAS